MSGGPVSTGSSSPGAPGDESPAIGDVFDGGVAADLKDAAGVGDGSAVGAGVGDDVDAAVGIDGGVDGALDQASLTAPACAAVGSDVNRCVTTDAAEASTCGVVGRTGTADAACAVGADVTGSVAADAAAAVGGRGGADLACVADPGIAVGVDATGGTEADTEVVGVVGVGVGVGVGVTVAGVIGVAWVAVGVEASGDVMADPIGGVEVSLALVVVGVGAAADSPRLVACASGGGDPAEAATPRRVD